MKLYGPYSRSDGRKHVILYDQGKRRTVSYPKYLMEQHLGRSLTEDETVDHINGDCTDDRIENLQILSRSANAAKQFDDNPHLRAKYYYFQCPVCSNMAFQRLKDVKHNRKKGSAGPFCSKSCASKNRSTGS